MRILLTFFAFTFALAIVAQTTYYVDATSGNDSNTGTSPSSAWQTIAQVNNQFFLAGDTILFKRGEIWKNEQLEIVGYSGNSLTNIAFGAYPNNADPKPIFTSITEQILTWTNVGGNLWKVDTPPLYHPERIWIDGIEWLRGNTVAEIDGVNFLWCYDGNGDLFISSVSNPASHVVEFTNDILPIYVEDAHYIFISNLDLQGSWTTLFLNNNVSRILIDQMNIGKNATSGIDLNSDTAFSPHHVQVMNCSFDANFTEDYSMASFYLGTDERGVGDGIFVQSADSCEFNNNFFKNWGHASINIDGNPFGGATVKVSYISVHDNEAISPDICYGGRMAIDDAHHCELYNNKLINTSIQSQFNGFNNHVHHNIIDGTTNTPILDNAVEISAGIDINGYSNTEVHDNIYENNLIKNVEGVGIQISTSGNYNVHNNIIRNNIILNCGTVPEVLGIGILVEANSVDSQTSNNLFQNNLVYNSSTNNTVRFANSMYDINGFNGLSGMQGYSISNNISSPPLFVNEAIGDFHLSPSSPCIDAGTTSLSTFDYEGNSIPYAGSNYDIGIYEYQGLADLNENKENPFVIFPNPVKDQLTILSKNSASIDCVRIVNLNGQLVLEKNKLERIDVSSLQSGVYFVEIKSGENFSIEKVIVRK